MTWWDKGLLEEYLTAHTTQLDVEPLDDGFNIVARMKSGEVEVIEVAPPTYHTNEISDISEMVLRIK